MPDGSSPTPTPAKEAPFALLFVATDPTDLGLIRTMLNSVRNALAFTLEIVPSVDQALTRLSEADFDVILLDHPEAGGAELPQLDRLRRHASRVPVLLLAENLDDCTPVLAAQRGAADLLLKRFLAPYLLVRAVRHAAERRRSREALRSRQDKFAHYQEILVDLAKQDDSDLERSLRRLTEASATTLDVARVGVWFFDETHSEIVCHCLATRPGGGFEKGLRLTASEYPRYFAALEESRVVAAEDARRDPRTSEFASVYLEPLGIGSMLDAPIRLHGRLIGVVCHEHVGGARNWPLEEREFASSIADLVALAQEAALERRMAAELREERNLIEAMLDSSSMLVAVLDAAGRVVRSNRAFRHLSGYGEAEAFARPFWELVGGPDQAEEFRQILGRPASEASGHQHEHSWVTRQGARARVSWTVVPLNPEFAEGSRCVVTGVDITERKSLEEQLVHDAFHDSLTGLPNRALFLDRLGHSLRQTVRRKEHRFAVLFVDMDRFKLVNDSLGHLFGDQFLREIARRLERCVRPGDTIARFGGDEFTLLIEDSSDPAIATMIADRIHGQLKEPVRIAGQDVFTTASIGIALSETGYALPEDMLRDADLAMYRAKARGGACHEVFDRSMHARAVSLLKLESELRRALERGEFEVHYQPIVELHDGKVRGFEALVRWNHPERGRVPPSEFIPVCEDTGIIIDLDRWVLGEASRQLGRWKSANPKAKDLHVSVNLSVKQFSRPDILDTVRNVVRTAGAGEGGLCLEITETVLFESAARAAELLGELRKCGIRLHLDDFGTGYSSLGYLHRFPVDALKIDRSFINGMKADGEGQEIVRAIVAMAQNLDLQVIAEGVEEDHQRQALRDLRCEYAQGYMFSRPLPLHEADALVAGALCLGA
jgi:diguanylate cyclase (GGDEF)-like protein/PAS domain S-box-containing protein